MYNSEDIRNIALIGHSGSGKTTIVEAMLYTAGAISRQGNIDDGTTISDYRTDEVNRKISIATSLLQFEQNSKKINVFDTPGYSDFVGEVKSALRVADLAVVSCHAVAGIEVGTEQSWNFANDYGVGKFIVVNFLNKEHADFSSVLEMLKKRFGHNVLAFQFPVNAGPDFNSIIDVLRGKLLKFSTDGSGKKTFEEIPDDLKDKADSIKQAIIDSAAESDDALLEKFLGGEELSEEEVHTGIKNAVTLGSIFPVFCMAADLNIGASELMDAIVDYAPAPTDMPTQEGKKPDSDEIVSRDCSITSPTTLFVFKTVSEAHVGELSFFRSYGGTVKPGMDLQNTSQHKNERFAQIYEIKGRDRKEVGEVIAGDIGAVVKLKNTHTGDTLSDPKAPLAFHPTEFPTPCLSVAVEPKAKGDEDKIGTGLASLHEEDPSFNIEIDPELSQMVIHAQGELHLEVVLNRLKDRYGVEVDIKPPKIPYRETIKSTGDHRAKYKKQTGGRGQYGDARVKVEPKPRGEGVEFVNKVVGGVIPSKFIPSVEKGIIETTQAGVIAGSKIVDVKATVFDGSHHAVDSSDIAFKIAGAMAFKQAFLDAKPVILEPIYDIEVKVPEEYMGDVMGDITARRGKIAGMETDGHFQMIKAKVPLAELHKYSTALRSITGGRGLHSQLFSHYEEAPKDVEQKIIAGSKGKEESE